MVSDVMVGSRSKTWEYAFLVAAAVAGAAIVIAYWQHQQVIQLTAALAAENNQSAQLQQQVAQQTADIQRQSTVIQAEAKPDLPLSVGFRPALFGTGLVMELRNNSGSQLEVAAAFSSEATGLTQQRNIVLAPNLVLQLGSAQGWAFVPGQRITFRNVHYRPAEVVVPQRG